MIELDWPNTTWALTYFILEWILRLMFIALVVPSREPSAARIWLLFGFLAPVPAAIMYAMFGRVRNPRKRSRREAAATVAHRQWHIGLRSQYTPRKSMLSEFVGRLGGNPPVPHNDIQLLSNYNGFISTLIETIQSAHTRVFIQAYIFADDHTGRSVISALAAARRRGVAVYVMLDAYGSRRWCRGVKKRLKNANVYVRVCNTYNPLVGGTGRLDRRNHRKLYVIDDQLAFMGSQNIISSDFRPGITNKELMLRIVGPLVSDLSARFITDWHSDGGVLLPWPKEPSFPSDSGVQAQLLATGPDGVSGAYTLLLSRLLQEARHSLLVVSPYTVLDEGLRLAMATAVTRGVRVTLLLSAVVDQPLVRLAQEAAYASLLESGVEIRHFERCLLHAKYVLADNSRVIIGSSNADIRSLQINAEVSLISEDEKLATLLGQVAKQHLSKSSVLTAERWAERPRWRRFLQRVAALASPLL